MMHRLHTEILDQIKHQSPTHKSKMMGSSYSGSSHSRFGLSVPETRALASTWAKGHKTLSFEEFSQLINSLFHGESTDEKKVASELLRFFPKHRELIPISTIETCLTQLEGWEEIDTLCHSIFTVDDVLKNWSQWQPFLDKLSHSSHISQQRASLVLLTGPVSQSEDKRLAELAFQNIDRLKSEKSILITKAISWLLRSLIRHHREHVETYLNQNESLLPKIAVREARNKLRTGRK